MTENKITKQLVKIKENTFNQYKTYPSKKVAIEQLKKRKL